MDKKFEGKPIVRDIEICKKCVCFKQVNDPIVGRGWRWGVGVYCSNCATVKGQPWCVETRHAVTEEEFIRATKLWADDKFCPQYKKEKDV